MIFSLKKILRCNPDGSRSSFHGRSRGWKEAFSWHKYLCPQVRLAVAANLVERVEYFIEGASDLGIFFLEAFYLAYGVQHRSVVLATKILSDLGQR